MTPEEWRSENRRWHHRLADKMQDPLMSKTWEILYETHLDQNPSELFVGFVFEDINDKLYSYVMNEPVRGDDWLPKEIYKTKVTMLRKVMTMFHVPLTLPLYSQAAIFHKVHPYLGCQPPYEHSNYIEPG